MLNADLDLGGP